MQRCGGTAFIMVIPSAGAHRSFLIHTDRVFIGQGGGDDGGLEGTGRGGGDFPFALSPVALHVEWPQTPATKAPFVPVITRW